MQVLVTGGAGFVGSAVTRWIIEKTSHSVVVFDKLTYAGNLESLDAISRDSRYAFRKGDICDAGAVQSVLSDYNPHIVMHLAAETHVDRSIDDPNPFIQTNLFGTYVVLQATLAYWRGLSRAEKDGFRFQHVSTDEVFGSLGETGVFDESTAYAPNSPYAASKAGADHLVRAWHHTFGLPTIVTNCSNNYGPYHFPEKLIPMMIINAIKGLPLPVYGRGENVRDWLYVEDHAEALLLVGLEGVAGKTYNIGGGNQRRNLDVVEAICDLVDELFPGPECRRKLIRFVEDRPGHDLRYALDASRIRSELHWQPRHHFEDGLRKTVEWYLTNRKWWEGIDKVYGGERLGLMI